MLCFVNFSLASYFLNLQQNTDKIIASFSDHYDLGMRLIGEQSYIIEQYFPCAEQFTLNNISLFPSHTGYIGSKSFLERVYELVLELKQNNSDITYGQC